MSIIPNAINFIPLSVCHWTFRIQSVVLWNACLVPEYFLFHGNVFDKIRKEFPILYYRFLTEKGISYHL
jgi:hypothetical protein